MEFLSLPHHQGVPGKTTRERIATVMNYMYSMEFISLPHHQGVLGQTAREGRATEYPKDVSTGCL